MSRTIRIGGASGAWGDSPGAVPQLLAAGVDYLVMDFLAEVTMSLLARARLKDPAFGFPPDFVGYLKRTLPQMARNGIKVVSNAGGVNPAGCKAAMEAVIAESGLSLKVAAIEGDDLLPIAQELGVPGMPSNLLTANAYLGALPIAAALAAGADIVITGRCADSALALGILMHEFGWTVDDYDKLGAGSLVGHILECGPQATGGNFTDWEGVPGWENIGYPIATCSADGSFVVGKPAGSGGMVTPAVIAEQTLYEIGDPAAYILPDVVADFSQVRLSQLGPDQVRVSGARGRPPTGTYKVSATYQDGWRGVLTVSIVGVDAARKAERTAAAMIARAQANFAARGLPAFSATQVEALGAEASYGTRSATRASREVMLRLVVDHPSREAIDIFAREAGSIGLSCAPGTTGIYSGRPKPTPVVRLFTFYLDKHKPAAPRMTVGSAPSVAVPVPLDGGYVAPPPGVVADDSAIPDEPTTPVPLSRLAYARSGDKGNSSNIAIIARQPRFLPLLRREVTAERILAQLGHLAAGPVVRFEAPGLNALNFLVDEALGGGGMASLRIDPQGKAYGQMVLEMSVATPVSWANACTPAD